MPVNNSVNDMNSSYFTHGTIIQVCEILLWSNVKIFKIEDFITNDD